MKKLLALLIFATSIVNAQYTVKGTMTPPEKTDWVILYKIEGAKQKFILNSTIKFDTILVGGEQQVLGKFQLDLPKDTKPGAYRATYRNKGAGFVDFYFNKENVEFIFNPKYPDESAVFTSSRENKLYNEYLEAYIKIQNKIDKSQGTYITEEDKEAKKTYKKAIKELEDVQDMYENKSEGMLVNHFIKATQRYNPSSPIDNMEDYMASTIDNFFKYIDFDSDALYNSSFLMDRINDYVFYLNSSEDKQVQQKLLRKAIVTVMKEIPKGKLKKTTLEFLITSLADKRNGEAVDWMLADYYDKLPSDQFDAGFKEEKLTLLRATIGRIAPDFTWQENGEELKLSTLNDGEKYLLIFWSTGCPHCVKEIPVLHESMKNRSDVSIISFGIENDNVKWTEFVKTLPNWHNAIGTHPTWKWDNETVKMYQLLATPSYFVLDSNKKIIAMPDHMEDVQKFFENN
ncbi:TlpA disulfide reductase family protein [Tenacibaculum soleae]|uniref:TlpA family protein disulfide reductase n=1 Tax=Tenacibaculum soleae TaxID=447689 RepID=UPI0026E35F6C|nr:TlpA disulfide reductase family protein [Tenacibaculum soleae]MDO6744237.1 TlpA disulfide reductase family protein [Tenacibaculum soleae]